MPIGTILAYIGDLSKIPKGWYLCDGTHGTPDLRGRFLEGCILDAKQYIKAGLPNITGYTGGCFLTADGSMHSPWNGALYKSYTTGPDTSSGAFGRINAWEAIGFNAALSNPIYSNSVTVQPRTYTVYYIMRVK